MLRTPSRCRAVSPSIQSLGRRRRRRRPLRESLGGIAVDPKTGGAVIDGAGNPVKTEHYADATVNKKRGVVICSTADPNQLAPGSSALQVGIYHGYDYLLYYFECATNEKAGGW